MEHACCQWNGVCVFPLCRDLFVSELIVFKVWICPGHDLIQCQKPCVQLLSTCETFMVILSFGKRLWLLCMMEMSDVQNTDAACNNDN